MSFLKRLAPGLIIVVLLILAFWWPALVKGRTLIHGDSIVHGLPMLSLEARALHGGDSLLWTNRVYGGHPIFAESTGAFANPINLLIAGLLPPVYGHKVFHFLYMLIAGFGAYGLCRALNASPWAASFGSVALVFSTLWIHSHDNLAISGALAWAPALFWAAEVWLKRPTLTSAVILALLFGLMVLAGYPQVAHGVALYLIVAIAPTFIFDSHKDERKKTLWTGAFAALLAVGFASVQLLPLFELSSLSHRSGGIRLLFPDIPSEIFIRGFLFNLTAPEEGMPHLFPGAGSLLVCATAVSVLFFRTSLRVKGHIISTLLLFQLGLVASPLFHLLYRWNLIPGLHFFRAMTVYLCISIVGLAVLSSAAIDGLVDYFKRNLLWHKNVRGIAVLCIYALFWVCTVLYCYFSVVPAWQFLFFGGALLGVLVLAGMNRESVIPVFLFSVLIVEAITLRFHEFHFSKADLLQYPESLTQLSKDYRLDDYKFIDSSLAVTYAMTSPMLNHDVDLQRMLSSGTALSNLIWNVPSINGALALPVRARAMLDPVFEDEVRGRSVTGPGQRAIDILGVRFIAVDEPRDVPGFRVAYHDTQLNTWIMENTAALPRFQTYTRNIVADTPDAALDLLKTPREPELIIEGEPNSIPLNSAPNDPEAIKFFVREASSTHYVVDVDAAKPGWLFLADANYPGWAATLDSAPVKVYSAQLLGKAVAVPAGKHRVEISFTSASFRIGLLITIATCLLAVLLVVLERCRRKKQTLPLQQNADQFS